jgi:hypothetical protein
MVVCYIARIQCNVPEYDLGEDAGNDERKEKVTGGKVVQISRVEVSCLQDFPFAAEGDFGALYYIEKENIIIPGSWSISCSF